MLSYLRTGFLYIVAAFPKGDSIWNIFIFIFPYAGRMEKSAPGGLCGVPVQSFNRVQTADQSYQGVSNPGSQADTSALGLLALNYGNSSDSEEDQAEPEFPACADEAKPRICSPESVHQCGENAASSPMQDCPNSAIGGLNLSSSGHVGEDEVPPVQIADCFQPGPGRANRNDGSHRTFDHSVEFRTDDLTSDHSVEFRTDDLTSIKSNGLAATFSDPMTGSQITSDCSQDAHGAEKAKFGQTIISESRNMLLAPRSDEDSSRMHVFCLEHAVEVEQQLRPIGGVHILLLCHPGVYYNSSYNDYFSHLSFPDL